MTNGERPRAENLEEERNPERAVNDTITAVENRDAADPVIQSEWLQKGKQYIKTAGGRTLDFSRFGMFTAAKAVWGLVRFTKKAIEKKGKVTFGEGYEIGEWIVDTENKKNKN